MAGIYFAAFLTTVLAIGIFGTVIHRLNLPANERLVWLAALIALPLQLLTFYFVRVPLDQLLVAYLQPSTTAHTWLSSLYAPLTEEPAKLVPLLIPAVVRDIRQENFVRYALAIGVAFAIGEMWFVAERITRVPNLAALPFYQFFGYSCERLLTCVFHSTFVSVALWRLRSGFALGFAVAVALHWLGNLPVFLMAGNVGELGESFWQIFVCVFLVFYFYAAATLLAYFAFGRIAPQRIFYGPRHCPECVKEYDAPLFALNFGRIRYERCPHCLRWHWTRPSTIHNT
ncbi:MAG: hypothetical protein U1A77_24985 [Pirellulales bacterium]